MSELIEKDPQLVRIVDARTSRNLLEDPHPLEADLGAAANLTVSIRVENGPEAPVEVAITADHPWLAPRSPKLALMGGETGECQVVVQGAGDGEFANLCFSWPGSTGTYREYVLVWRKPKAEPVLPPSTARPTAPTVPPVTTGPGVAPPPSWLPKRK